MTIDPTLLTTAFLLGLAGAGHCLGMCGGISAALNLGEQRTLPVTLSYHLGRISSYTLLGAALGFAAGSIDMFSWNMALRYLAGALLIAMGLSIGNWWQGISVLERAGAYLWKPVQKLSRRWLPVRHWYQSFGLGLCWGMMPCGLIYSSLAFAATAQDAVTSAAIMLCFGIGTLPAMLTVSFGAQRLQGILRNAGFKRVIAVLLIAAGCWTIYLVYSHAGHGHTQHTAPANTGQHEMPASHAHH